MSKRHILLPCLLSVLLLAACSSPSSTPPAGPAARTSTVSAASALAPAAGASAAASSTATPAAPASVPAAAATTAAIKPPVAPPVDTGRWVEGKNYFRIEPAQPTDDPSRVVVTEVFSFACPACNHFEPIMDKIAASLPAYAKVEYLPAGFIPTEDWPAFQRAYFAAQALGVDARSHDAMFDAVWKTGELATDNLVTGQLKSKMPSLEQIAGFYARYGVKPADFVATANSFAVSTKVRRADQTIQAMGVVGTPTLVIDGKYRLDVASAGGYPQTIELVQWLVQREGSKLGAASK
jgi:thiol:disulfide interchange protein DsbA